MGLYLAIFDQDEELDGVEVGLYSDFSYFRNKVIEVVENGQAGSQCPTLIMHSDCDGEWTAEQARSLEAELRLIETAFRAAPAIEFNSKWHHEVANTFGIKPETMYESFFDVDGEPLIDRLISLAQQSHKRDLSILFQ